MLPGLADKLVAGFAATRQGCFLWATDSIVREFSEHAEGMNQELANAVMHFYERQASTSLQVLNDVPAEQLPDLIEDFFRMNEDILRSHPSRAVFSPLMPNIIQAASFSLSLLKIDVLVAILRFLQDFVQNASANVPYSSFEDESVPPPEVQSTAKQLLLQNGEELTTRLLAGMMYSFPEDCIADASAVILELFHVLPEQTAAWISSTLGQLPAGAIRPREQEKLVKAIQNNLNSGELRKIRTLLQDFTTSYRRRNVGPREGLGRLEPKRFSFSRA